MCKRSVSVNQDKMWTACNSCSTFFLSNKFLEFIRWRKVWHAYTFLYHNILHNAFDAIGNMFLEINPKTELCWSAQEQEGWLQHKYPRQNMQTWAELLYPTHFSSERNIWFARYTARAKHNKANSRKWLLAWFCFYNNCWDCWQLTSWRFILWLLNMKSQSWFPTSSAQLGPVVADCPAMSFVFGTLPKKKTGKCGNFEKTGGGGLPESHFHVLLFLTWENPQKRS